MAPHDKPDDAGRETTVVQIGDLTVTMKRPLPGQRAALRRIMHLLKSDVKAEQNQGGSLFLDVADTLVTDPAILQRLYEGLATEKIVLDQYAQGLFDALAEFFPKDADEESDTPAAKSTRTRARAGTSTRGRR